MRFAVCNETFENWKLDDVFACVAELGYSGIEIAPFTIATDVRDVPNQGRTRLRRLADREGLQVTALHWLLAKTSGLHLTSADAGVRQLTAEYLVELIRFCSDLGGEVMVFGSPKQRDLLNGMPYEDGLRNACEVFQKILPIAEERRVTIAFEPLARRETNFINTADQAIELVQRVAHPNFRLHLDVKAMCDMGKPLAQIIRESSRHLAYFHANDPDGRGPGTSGLDHQPIAAALREVAYAGWVSVEVFDYKPDPRAIASHAIGYLNAIYR